MRSFFYIITIFISVFQSVAQNQPEVPVYNFDSFKPLISKNDEKIYVVNFWATWCAPCVKELPYFEEINKNYKTQNVEVILVSLDFAEHLERRVIPFIQKNNLQSKIVLLDDTNSNYWIPRVSEPWSGAIPATLIYTKNQRKFYEKSFTYNELETELKNFLP